MLPRDSRTIFVMLGVQCPRALFRRSESSDIQSVIGVPTHTHTYRDNVAAPRKTTPAQLRLLDNTNRGATLRRT
ncbi:Hypothetical protein CINCED_3A016119, partial [Cinara cedri]